MIYKGRNSDLSQVKLCNLFVAEAGSMSRWNSEAEAEHADPKPMLIK